MNRIGKIQLVREREAKATPQAELLKNLQQCSTLLVALSCVVRLEDDATALELARGIIMRTVAVRVSNLPPEPPTVELVRPGGALVKLRVDAKTERVSVIP